MPFPIYLNVPLMLHRTITDLPNSVNARSGRGKPANAPKTFTGQKKIINYRQQTGKFRLTSLK
jgi:hypothetical protein